MMDFKNKSVTVMGLGLYEKGTGIEAVKFFLRQGAIVTVTDVRSAKDLAESVEEVVRYYNKLPKLRNPSQPPLTLRGGEKRKLTFILGKHREEDFKNADVVFQNPSVPAESPYLRITAKHGVPIVNDWSLFLSRHTPKLFIGVTGTRGKSTTTALIYEMLKFEHSPIPRNRRMASKVWLAGNLGVSPLAFIDEYRGEPIVAELSSWLLHHFPAVKKSPTIAVVTNIMDDHMDKYKSVKEYIADKEHILRFQKKSDVAVLNYDNDVTLKMGKRVSGRVVWFSVKKHVPRWVPLEKILLQGEHNRANALAAACAAEAAGVSRVHIMDVLKTFKGLPNRLQLVRTVRGIQYYNDTTATTPDATIAALKVLGVRGQVSGAQNLKPKTWNLKPRIVLIAGGADKKLEYRELAKYVKQYCKAVVLLPGTATAKLKKEVSTAMAGQAGVRCQVSEAHTMRAAVKKAHLLAQEGDVVLLSPGAASFGLFKNEFDRGDQFVDAVKKV